MITAVKPEDIHQKKELEITRKNQEDDDELKCFLNVYLERHFIDDSTPLVFCVGNRNTRKPMIETLHGVCASLVMCNTCNDNRWLLNDYYNRRGEEQLRRFLKSYEEGWNIFWLDADVWSNGDIEISKYRGWLYRQYEVWRDRGCVKRIAFHSKIGLLEIVP
jgi:hypothetical protein